MTGFTKKEDIKRDIHLVDAKGKILGRLATRIATLLVGKNKVDYSPHVDNGDIVKVENADAFAVSADKKNTKLYRRYTGYPGGLRERKLKDMSSEEIIHLAVSGMLPKNKFRSPRLRRLSFVKPNTKSKAKK